MDIITDKYKKALALQRERCGGHSAQRERNQLYEETGELISALSRMSKNRADRHDLISEIADVMICMAALLERHDFSQEYLNQIIDEKVEKWLRSEEALSTDLSPSGGFINGLIAVYKLAKDKDREIILSLFENYFSINTPVPISYLTSVKIFEALHAGHENEAVSDILKEALTQE